jgi:hypothetical protein
MATYFDPNNQATYSLWLKNPQGQLLKVIDDFLFLETARAANEAGSLKVVVEKNNLPSNFLVKDSIIEVWRKLTGFKRAYLEGETQFRIVKTRETSTGSGIDLEIVAMDTMELMNRAVVAYPAGSAHASKSAVAGTVIYQFVYENMDIVGAVDVERWQTGGFPAAWFRLAPNMGFGAAINSRDAIGKSVLAVCQDAARQSKELGTYIYFDIVYVAANQLEFRIYDGQRGINHGAGSGQEIVLSEAAGTLENTEKTVDYTGQISVAYALGAGQQDARLVGKASDAALLALSPFGRIEKSYDARQTTLQASLDNIAQETLGKYRLKTIINGGLADGGLRYGIDYGFGDRLQIGFQSETYTARVNGIKITLNEGKEEIRAALEVEQ